MFKPEAVFDRSVGRPILTVAAFLRGVKPAEKPAAD
jgi:hypothetical protein